MGKRTDLQTPILVKRAYLNFW